MHTKYISCISRQCIEDSVKCRTIITKKRRKSHGKPSLSALALAIACSSLQAGGFDSPVIATAMQGSSNANHAEARDASVIFFNPAGITRLNKTQISLSNSLISARGRVENLGTEGTAPPSNTDNGPTPAGETIQGSGPGAFWPSIFAGGALFASMPWNDEITLGFGAFPAAGGNLNYKADWWGRNFADSVAVEIINFNSVAAIRFDEKHSLGFGTSLYAGHLKQKLQIDIKGIDDYLLQPVIDDVGVGTVGSLLSQVLGTQALPTSVINALSDAGLDASLVYSQLPPELKGAVAGIGGDLLLGANSNGSGTIEQYGWGLGANIGYLYSFNDDTRLGIAYRSKSRMQFRGEIDWEVSQVSGNTDNVPVLVGLPAPDGSGNVSGSDFLSKYYRPDATTKSIIYIPARLSVGLFHAVNKKLELLFDYTFIESSVVEGITVEILNVKSPDGTYEIEQKPGTVDQFWKDSFKVSVGMNYHWNDELMLRAGYQFDKTPIPSARYRHPSAPDSNRHMFSVGANYKYKDDLTIDAAYSFVALEDSYSLYRDTCRGAFKEDEGSFTSNKEQDCTGNGGTFRGRFYDTMIHILGLQFNKTF